MRKISQWQNCYDDSLKGLITKDTKHPAKMAKALCERIFDHGVQEGYWKRGSTILDPYFGIGTVGIIGAGRGYQVIGMELEKKFYDMAVKNIEMHNFDIPPRVLLGDSRKFAEVVAPILEGSERGVITSPPFAGNTGGTGKKSSNPIDEKSGKGVFERHAGSMRNSSAYGATEGQINNLPQGDFAVITSPPFGERMAYRDSERGMQVQEKLGKGGVLHQSPGETSGQVAQLDSSVGVVTSPPYEQSRVADMDSMRRSHDDPTYGKTEGQVGYSGKGGKETYWDAVAAIYASVGALLPVGSVMAVVVKDYVKNKQRVPFCENTAQVLEMVGFDVIEEVHAMMVKGYQNQMFDPKPKELSRKSFFRRVVEAKGAPPIDYEVVLFARKK